MVKGWLAGFSTWAVAGLSGVGAVAATYWGTAPDVLRYAALALGPLLFVDALSSMWFCRYANSLAQKKLIRPQAEMQAILHELEQGRTWTTAAMRMGMTICLLVLALAFDGLTGTKHNTVLWILLWADGGHARFTLRRLAMMAENEGIEVPMFPNNAWESIGRPKADEAGGTPALPDEDEHAAPATELPRKGE